MGVGIWRSKGDARADGGVHGRWRVVGRDRDEGLSGKRREVRGLILR